MPKEQFDELLKDNDSATKIDSAELRVEELWPAIYENAPPEETVRYLSTLLQLAGDEDLYGFGRR